MSPSVLCETTRAAQACVHACIPGPQHVQLAQADNAERRKPMRLVADIGGTNARFALARDGVVQTSTLRSFRNQDHTSFDSQLGQFLARHPNAGITSAVVAVAGPVSGPTARLTNRDWQFDARQLSKTVGGAPAHLINDLTALGHALPTLQDNQLVPVHLPDQSLAKDAQALIIGIGTGFNVSPVLRDGDRLQCLAAEFGHVSMPGAVTALGHLQDPEFAERFPTVEDCFSGRGYAALGDPALFAALTGALARDLALAFLPRGGIYFAGGVARAVLSGPAHAEFLREFTQTPPGPHGPDAPVYLIADDAAALAGCARLAL